MSHNALDEVVCKLFNVKTRVKIKSMDSFLSQNFTVTKFKQEENLLTNEVKKALKILPAESLQRKFQEFFP